MGTLSLKLNNQTLPTTKHPKTLGTTFDPQLTFSQFINLTVIKAKQNLIFSKHLLQINGVNKTNKAFLHLKLSFAHIGI